MALLLSSWLMYFGAFYCSALASGALARRGFLPLHTPAAAGIAAYVFAALCARFPGSFFLSAMVATFAAIVFAVFAGSLFLRIRGANAALASIAVQLLFEQHSRTASWTGGAQGLWQGLQSLQSIEKVSTSLGLCFAAVVVYRLFGTRAATPIFVADGVAPLLLKSVSPISSFSSLVVSNVVFGFCAACAGLMMSLQFGLVSPGMFSLYQAILYVAAILVAGYLRAGHIAIAAAILGLLPEALRFAGLGTVTASSWRGFLVGSLVLVLVVLQLPRWSRSVSPQLSESK